jgi:hypothetical protein
MTCDEAKHYFLDLIYHETTDAAQEQLETHLQVCSKCSQEVSELRQISTRLQTWKNVNPPFNLMFLNEPQPGWRQVRTKIVDFFTTGWKWSRAFVYGLALILMILSLANLKITRHGADFSISLSVLPQPTAPASTPLVVSPTTSQPPLVTTLTQADLVQFQQEQLEMINQLIRASEKKQQQQYLLTLGNLVNELQQQRASDLRLVGSSLEQFQSFTQRRIERTDASVNGILKIIQVQYPQFER